MGRGRTHLTWGASFPLSLPWPHPRWVLGAAATPRDGTLDGGTTLPLPLYILGGFGAAKHRRSAPSWRSPTSLPPRLSRCLAKPCWSATLLPHHHAVVLLLDGVFPNLSLSPCWIKARETSSGCTCVEHGGAVVWRLDRIRPRSESLSVRLHRPRSCNASAS